MEQWRIALLGERCVGKTTLAFQFTQNCFVEHLDPTIEDRLCKQFIVDNRMCSVDLIEPLPKEDCAVREERWTREAQGYILVYSIASRWTFDRLEVFYQTAQRSKEGDQVLMLVGNKSDNTSEREVSKDEGAALARRFGCEFIETSAKTAQNVDRVFTNLVRALRGATDQIPLKEKKKKKKCLIL
ncbi:P-loop containing nucleoside triphosphate hydrolase protein [Mycena galopus ATCC 62051]|nr:P-loop containing nucleoside triphosphate hydrolase protein [Mycena galopus ATCC 62051]